MNSQSNQNNNSEERKMLCELKNKHNGETAIIICNGPSLNNTDFSLIRDKTIIGLNKIYLGFEKYDFYPKYLVAVNKKVLIQSEEPFRKLSCLKFLSNRCSDIYSPDANTIILDTFKPNKCFYEDISEGCNEGSTVTYVALQVAYYLGFKRVVIVGMDHRFAYEGNPHESSTINGADPNHFSADYFGGGQQWDNPDLVTSEESYRVARRIYEEDGREIIDATVNGACDVFEKTSLKEIQW